MGTIIMNPLADGLLAREGDRFLDFLRAGDYGPWYGALRFLLANKSITTTIVGYRSVAEVDLDVRALDGAEALGDAYRRDLAAKMAATKLVGEDFCTGCGSHLLRDVPRASRDVSAQVGEGYRRRTVLF